MSILPGDEHLVGEQPDPIALALLRHLRQTAVLDHNDVIAIADALDEEGETEAAHDVRLTAIDVTPASEYEAQRRRDRFGVIDGGNREG